MRRYGLRAGYFKEIYDYHKKKGKMSYDVLIDDILILIILIVFGTPLFLILSREYDEWKIVHDCLKNGHTEEYCQIYHKANKNNLHSEHR